MKALAIARRLFMPPERLSISSFDLSVRSKYISTASALCSAWARESPAMKPYEMRLSLGLRSVSRPSC